MRPGTLRKFRRALVRRVGTSALVRRPVIWDQLGARVTRRTRLADRVVRARRGRA